MELTLETQYSNSVINLSKEDLINDYNSILKHYRNLQAELEEKDQVIYNCKRELTRFNTLKFEYVSEIESLQSQEGSECEELKSRIQDLETRKIELNFLRSKKIKDLEKTISKGDNEISKLQNKLESLKCTSNSNNEKEQLEELQLNNTECKNVINNLENEIMILKDKSNFFEKQHLMNVAHNNNIQKDLNILNENYECVKEELAKAKQLNESLQEDYMLSKQKLEVIKSKPLQDGSQGNSLFAEVDNKRLELQERMAFMESRYLKMKDERTKLLADIASLNDANGMLCQKWESESNENFNENEAVEERYKAKIKILEGELETYISEMLKLQKISSKNLKSGEIKFMENMLEVKNKDIAEVLRQGEMFSISRILLSHELRESNQKMRYLRAKATKYEFEIGKLQAEIESSKMKLVQTVAPSRSKKSLLKDVGNAIARINALEHGYSMVDYSRQIKRSRMKSDINFKSCDAYREIIESKDEINSSNNVPQNIDSSVDTIKNSENNIGKLTDMKKVVNSKQIFKKKY